MTDVLVDDLLSFIGASPTPFHAVENAKSRFLAVGFTNIAETSAWSDLTPGGYVLTHGGSSLLAFVVPETTRIRGFRIVGAHTDSPNLRLKPNAEYRKEGYAQLGVEVYGGALINSWLDRDLSIAGRVCLKTDSEQIDTRLVKFNQPIARVAQLAIHLDRDVNEKGLLLNRQEHLAPIFGLESPGSSAFDESLALSAMIERELGVSQGSIASSDLMLYDVAAPARGGRSGELIFSARLDNLAMAHAAVTSLLDAAAEARTTELVAVAALFDHEEVGSASAYGAESSFFPRALERIVLGRGGSREDYLRALSGSLCLSADMAHAVHPNYESRHEPRHKTVINGGPVIKVNAQQRYATSAASAAHFRALCKRVDVPVQTYVHRTDLPCGSTIGPVVATQLGIRTVDVGNAMLSMHSIRELAGTEDPAAMARVLAAFYVSGDPESTSGA